jgi:hypothetical protein
MTPLRELWRRRLRAAMTRILLRRNNSLTFEAWDANHRLLKRYLLNYVNISYVPIGLLTAPLPRVHRTNISIDELTPEDIPGAFRFANAQQLRRLLIGFQFPDSFTAPNGSVYSGEEVLLCGLFRMHSPCALSHPGWKSLFGFCEKRASECFGLFLRFMMANWAYLLLDNIDFWVPYLATFDSKIKAKLAAMGCAFQDLRVFGFIDNTVNATCRPAGGPARSGPNAPRNDPLIQRAFYNGWKKLHGLKWQTIDLPNGMNFNVYGPVSCRRHDLFNLQESEINDKLATLSEQLGVEYYVYGDSAYITNVYDFVKARHEGDNLTPRQSLENRVLSSARECIEWDYGEVGKMWAITNYRYVLKMRKMPVASCCANRGSNRETFFDFGRKTSPEPLGRRPRHFCSQIFFVYKHLYAAQRDVFVVPTGARTARHFSTLVEKHHQSPWVVDLDTFVRKFFSYINICTQHSATQYLFMCFDTA